MREGSIPGSRRSPGEGNGNSLQYSCLGNPIDRGAWWATVHEDHRIVRHDLATKQQQQGAYYKYRISGSNLELLNQSAFLIKSSDESYILIID